MKFFILILLSSSVTIASNNYIAKSAYRMEINLILDSDYSFSPKWESHLKILDRDNKKPQLLLAINLPQDYFIKGVTKKPREKYNYKLPILSGSNSYSVKIQDSQQKTISQGTLLVKITPLTKIALTSNSCPSLLSPKPNFNPTWSFTKCDNDNYYHYNVFNMASYRTQKFVMNITDDTQDGNQKKFQHSLFSGFSYYKVNNDSSFNFINLGLSTYKKWYHLESHLSINFDFINTKQSSFKSYAIESSLEISMTSLKWDYNKTSVQPYLNFNLIHHKNLVFKDKTFFFGYLGLKFNLNERVQVFIESSLHTSLDSNSSQSYGFLYRYKGYDFILKARSFNTEFTARNIELDNYQLVISKRF